MKKTPILFIVLLSLIACQPTEPALFQLEPPGKDNRITFLLTPEGRPAYQLQRTTYEAAIYQDGADAHWEKNPLSIQIEKMEVDNAMTKEFTLAPGGGLAIEMKKK